MTISTADCKKAIVDYCQKNGKQIIEEAYGDFEDVDLCAPNDELDHPANMQEAIAPMLLEKNWKRMGKRRCEDDYDITTYQDAFRDVMPSELIDALFAQHKSKAGLTERSFNCNPYDDQLRAYVYDDGTQIVDIRVQGE